jgi:hypothetical protein
VNDPTITAPVTFLNGSTGVGNQSTSLQVGAYDNAKKPAGIANWFPQTQFTLLYLGG